jgi:hypothetical protein
MEKQSEENRNGEGIGESESPVEPGAEHQLWRGMKSIVINAVATFSSERYKPEPNPSTKMKRLYYITIISTLSPTSVTARV